MSDSEEAVQRQYDSYIKDAALRELVLPGGVPNRAPIRLLKASFVMRMGNCKVGRRQELEEAAFASPEMLERALKEVEETAADGFARCHYPAIVAVSYCWASPEHPDPEGKQFAMLQTMIRWYMANRAARGLDPDFCLFIDFHCLYQGADRTEEQLALFLQGLHSMDVVYAHRGTAVWVLSKPPDAVAADPARGSYFDRGWTSFELRVSSLAKSGSHVLDMGSFELERTAAGPTLMEKSPDAFLAMSDADKKALADPPGSYGFHTPDRGFLATLAKGREGPMHPAAFAEVIKSKNFSNESDKETVAELFEKVATAVLASLETADFSRVTWTPEQLASMGGSMTLCTKARVLVLEGCSMRSEGLAAFARNLTPAAAPALEKLNLHNNKLSGKKGWVELGGSLARGAMPRLKELILSGCSMRSEGLAAFARNLTPAAAPALETLDLLRNALSGKKGWVELGVALRQGALPSLREVEGTSRQGEAALRAAAPDREWDFYSPTEEAESVCEKLCGCM